MERNNVYATPLEVQENRALFIRMMGYDEKTRKVAVDTKPFVAFDLGVDKQPLSYNWAEPDIAESKGVYYDLDDILRKEWDEKYNPHLRNIDGPIRTVQYKPFVSELRGDKIKKIIVRFKKRGDGTNDIRYDIEK